MYFSVVLVTFIGTSFAAYERIVGGQSALLGEFPHQISLQYRNKHTCGGSILHPSYILTAAHCVEGRANPKDFAVTSGTNRLSEGQYHAVLSIVYHEKFSQDNLNHDLAIIKLQKPIIFNEYQKAIALPKTDIAANVSCTVSGWGLTSYPGNVASDTLQKMELNTYSNSECRKWHDDWIQEIIENSKGIAIGTIYEGIFCAFNKLNVGTCKGDSGGPLIIYEASEPIQVGIISWSWEYCARGVPDVFTRIYYYLDWIHNNTNGVLKYTM